jgi:hypothetical protein
MIDEFEDLQEEQEFDVELLGNFGRFVSSGSYPVEYFMASMPMAQAYKYLKFARDVQMDDINFDLLMQRDIDENRVEKEIMPYLQQDGATAATRPLFFPPLLAAIVPVKDEKIQEYYGVRSRITPKPNFVGVSWAGHFQLYGKLTSSSEGLALQSDQPEEKIKSKQAILKLRTSELDPHGVMLIVIDGQHRLRALKRLWQEHRDKVRDLVVPVCVMYAPNSHSDNSGKQNIPSVPRVFRNLFVDVNSTMTVVGGHFNILLSDKNVGDMTCRVFCDEVLTRYGKEGLACVEWNTRTRSQSYNVTKVHSLTSIGVLQRGLEENFKPDMVVSYILGISDSAEDLFPDGADKDDYYPKIKWDKFSYAQSNALKFRIKEHVAPLLVELYFESVPFKALYGHFVSEIDRLKADIPKGGRAAISAQAILQSILEYKPFDDKDSDFKKRWLVFEESIEAKRVGSTYGIVRYALFQRAFFNVAGSFVRIGIEYSVAPAIAFKAAALLLNMIFEKNSDVFSTDKTYLQYTVFEHKRIRARDETKAALRDLMLSHLLRADIRAEILKGFSQLPGSPLDAFLNDQGFAAAGQFLGRYREERAKSFKKGYELDYLLTNEEREDLRLKELEQRAMERDVKENRRDEGGLVRRFDIEVDRYIDGYFVEAKRDLRSSLGIAGDLLEKNTSDEISEVDDA